MSSFSKIPPKWQLTHWEKAFLQSAVNDTIYELGRNFQNEDISRIENNLKLLDAAVKQLAKNQLAKNLAQNPLFT